MGLRLDEPRRQALRLLWEAGEAGLAVLVADDLFLDTVALLRHGVIEGYTDPGRLAMVADRYRLTLAGRALCRQLFGVPARYPTKEST